jgi:hypothetical protein
MIDGFQELCPTKYGDRVGCQRQAITTTQFTRVASSKKCQSSKESPNSRTWHWTHCNTEIRNSVSNQD